MGQRTNQMEHTFTAQQTKERVPVNILIGHRAQDQVQMVLVLIEVVRPETFKTNISDWRTLAKLSLSLVLMK